LSLHSRYSQLTLIVKYEPDSAAIIKVDYQLPYFSERTLAAKMSDNEFGSDIEFTQELEDVLSAAETQTGHAEKVSESIPIPDIEEIEDLIRQSPMEEFRKKGYLSVSDLVGTVWCEVQVCPVM
jgi:hypothetical protein